MRTAVVVGCGVIGTSAALALRRRGVRVRLADRDPGAVDAAVLRGAGSRLRDGAPPADLVIVATPPGAVPAAVRQARARGLGRWLTDVASAKGWIAGQLDDPGFVPGHPMAGRELSGPQAARADLFTGRTWALCPGPGTDPGAVAAVREAVALCGARPVVLDAAAHDAIAAEVSHAPHLVAAAVAARFADADPQTLALTGQGVRDATRIASGSPALWRDILQQNADAVAAVLDSVAADLAAAAAALRGTATGPALTDLLVRGEHGRSRLLAAATECDHAA
ncbi:prephenate dehydrogenase [Actinocorallia sp. A-T 12471]|uniref:prephenate dehydrogenase n=1 Tax=Actinocorallia sp. A-T 12471 TaxID=3089813 RepID=UPI0029CF2912|nr:prephenate dehydrogenase [Actinocorallia sp. A-T 12471]MDX6741584.1 prephenate dehydrogenase [Actinocorallia sp. A-T 12471]